jgi:hypothetical protein
VPLAFHVDYWDRLGWTDRFASPQYTQRQYRDGRPGPLASGLYAAVPEERARLAQCRQSARRHRSTCTGSGRQRIALELGGVPADGQLAVEGGTI